MIHEIIYIFMKRFNFNSRFFSAFFNFFKSCLIRGVNTVNDTEELYDTLESQQCFVFS